MRHTLVLVGSLILSVWFIRWIVQRIRRRSINYLPGPPSPSWLVGHLGSFFRPKQFGDADLAFIREYGTTIHINTTFGRDVLFTCDPKALQYVFNTSGYNFPKTPDKRILLEILTGRGIAWAEGTQHARHRKIMNPAFSFSALREFIPSFTTTARKAVNKMKIDVLSDGKPQVINILSWLHRTTLDAIGETAFGHKFDVIDKTQESKLAKVYDNLMPKASIERPDFSIAFEAFLGTLPGWLITLGLKVPVGRFKVMRDYIKIAQGVAREIIDKQTELYLGGKEGGKDVMSLLIRANFSEDPKTKLTTEEIIPQMTTVFLAGHDSTATTTSWVLYQLSNNPEWQTRIREEIKAVKAAAAERGDAELSIADMDSMEYLLAAMKETLRYHPIVGSLARQARNDTVIPLDIPQKTKTGEIVTSIPISKGQHVMLSIFAYNRLEEVWGADADLWRPERFLEGVNKSQKTSIGVIGNLMTFSSGVRGCIGWRFAVLEMQSILIELLENFEFSLLPNTEIVPVFATIMTPTVRGEARRTQMPLVVKPL
ncbi:hypothetical protein M422DRAFT_37891 [Sphaerobolus stellatus SS14]|uniref:Cytochrome P450 n=1 Tax=Sphaerobolus stellatus (strain SS14) TaxID=990650 RepID=A0A0C9TZK1_SPHS4|nr:hypothetical protein M422DRAFT_37891 [Sphaerobolus stellatus SS14]